MKKIISILMIVGMLISCSEKSKLSEININGKLLSNNIDEVKLMLTETNIAINDKTFFADVNEDSTFSISISSEYSFFGSIHAGNYYHKIFLSPGDNLFIEIDGDTILYKGEGSNRNNFLYEVIEKKGLNGYSQLFQKAGTLLETANLSQIRRDNFIVALEENEKEYKLNQDFKDFLILNNKSEYEGFLMYYHMIFTYRNKTKIDSIEVPEVYTNLKIVNNFIDDSKLSTREYFYNMRNFIYGKMREITKVSPEKSDSAKQIVLFDSLSGKSKNYAIAAWLDNEFKFNDYDTLVYDRFKNEIVDTYAQELVQKSLDRYNAKQKLIYAPLNEEFNLTLLEDDKGNELTFADMVNKYKGKVIYLDFWSLGCGPCIASMPKSKELKEKLKNYPIEFVYLTTDKKNDNLWKEVYEVSLTEENHYRLVRGFDARLLKYMKINWVPNYMLIDKDSKLLSFLAVRPTDPKFEDEIMNYIN